MYDGCHFSILDKVKQYWGPLMWWLYVLGGIVFLLLLCIIKNAVWDMPHEEISRLKCDIAKLQSLHKDEISRLENRLGNSSSVHIQSSEFLDIVVISAWKELSELCNKEYAFLGIP